MRGGIADRPIRRLRRFAGALVLPLLGWIGCATLDRGQTLVPTRHQVRTGQFLLSANSPMTKDSSAVRCLQALERDVEHNLGFRPPATEDPVEIYVLEDRNAFDHFLSFYHPELPPRRAFFLAQGEDRVVYTYTNPRLEEDLRHEGTHALLHGAFGNLPLWLDEGLAEYFETDLSLPGADRARLELIAADLRGGWSPNLERLESLTDIRQMSPRDYREAWSWVHLFLNGPEPGKSILMGYLGETDRTGDNAHIAPRLAIAHLTNDRMLAHLKTLQAGPVAARPVREANSVRLQDNPIDATATSPASPRGSCGESERGSGSEQVPSGDQRNLLLKFGCRRCNIIKDGEGPGAACMYVDLIIWDDENEPHIIGPGEVTVEDVEEVIRDYPGSHDDPDDYSNSSGLPLIFGDTSTGKHIVVIFEDCSDDDYVVIRPLTSYPVRAYGD